MHLLLTGQGVHSIRNQLAEAVFHLPAERIRVTAPDVGGGFGMKNFLYPEWVLVLWAARRLGRPVKWIAERSEEFVSGAQGRDNHTRARLALDENGRFLALDVSTPRQSRSLSVDQRPGQLDQLAGDARWAASTPSRPSLWMCGAPSPTPCRSMPIAARASPRRIT